MDSEAARAMTADAFRRAMIRALAVLADRARDFVQDLAPAADGGDDLLGAAFASRPGLTDGAPRTPTKTDNSLIHRRHLVCDKCVGVAIDGLRWNVEFLI